MVQDQDLGSYFRRGGQKIELEKENEVFTVIAKDEHEVEQVRSLPGVKEVKSVQNRIFKVRVAQEQRDKVMARCRSQEMGGVTHHAYRPKESSNTRYYLTEEIVAKFSPNVCVKTIESILSEAGVRIIKDYPGSSNTFLLQVTKDAGKNPIKVANALEQKSEVEYAEPNLVNRFQSSYIPTDTLFERQWHLKSSEAPELVSNADVSATEAWEITRGRRDVVVAVVDDGFDLSHPDFSGAGKVVHPKDYVDGDANPFSY